MRSRSRRRDEQPRHSFIHLPPFVGGGRAGISILSKEAKYERRVALFDRKRPPPPPQPQRVREEARRSRGGDATNLSTDPIRKRKKWRGKKGRGEIRQIRFAEPGGRRIRGIMGSIYYVRTLAPMFVDRRMIGYIQLLSDFCHSPALDFTRNNASPSRLQAEKYE